MFIYNSELFIIQQGIQQIFWFPEKRESSVCKHNLNMRQSNLKEKGESAQNEVPSITLQHVFLIRNMY